MRKCKKAVVNPIIVSMSSCSELLMPEPEPCNFLEGGNWQREPSMNYRHSLRRQEKIEWVSSWEVDVEGLPNRWVTIIKRNYQYVFREWGIT